MSGAIATRLGAQARRARVRWRRLMARRILTRQAVGPDIPTADEAYIITLLDYYDFLAGLAQRGLVDVPLLLAMRSAAITRCYRICETYMADRRARVWPGLYACTQMFTEAYARRPG